MKSESKGQKSASLISNAETARRALRRIKLIYALISGASVFFAVTLFSLLKFFLIDSLKLSAWEAVCAALSYAAVIFSLYAYLYSNKNILESARKSAAAAAIIVFVYLLSMSMSLLNVYAMPLALGAVLFSMLVDKRAAGVVNFCVVLLVAIPLGIKWAVDPSGTELISLAAVLLTAIVSGTVSILALMRMTRRVHVVVTLLALNSFCAFGAIAAEFAFNPSGGTVLAALGYYFIGAVIHVSFGLLLPPIFEAAFNLLTDSRLAEISDFNSPLLKRLRSEAPGTFNHSLTVASLAETCAAAIGENTYFTRAAALCHDAGKLKNAKYFIENQNAGHNPHDGLLPEVSRDIIISHTASGSQILKEYGIPAEIAQIAVEHHGTMPIALFYNKAKLLTDGEVDMQEYRYPGPVPRSKAAALIMICDSCEAAVRSLDKPSPEKVGEMVGSLINIRLMSGQFDGCALTMNDISIIKETIVAAFGGLIHRRLQYPEPAKRKE